MIIDFHTHIFPPKIAAGAIRSLKATSGYQNFTDGTAEGLLKSMEAGGVALSVNLPVLTNPDSFFKTLEHLERDNAGEKRIISFAAIHPRCDDIAGKIDLISQMGFKGVKLHPLFQDEPIDSDRTEYLIDCASKRGLLTMIHPGFDVSFPDMKHAEPEKIVRMLEDVKPEGVILAHMGALEYWDEVSDMLCGRNVFFDTSFSMHLLGEEKFVSLARKHGVDKVLFGTDSPWRDQKDYVDMLNGFSSLTAEEKQKIFYLNAAKLLNAEV